MHLQHWHRSIVLPGLFSFCLFQLCPIQPSSLLPQLLLQVSIVFRSFSFSSVNYPACCSLGSAPSVFGLTHPNCNCLYQIFFYASTESSTFSTCISSIGTTALLYLVHSAFASTSRIQSSPARFFCNCFQYRSCRPIPHLQTVLPFLTRLPAPILSRLPVPARPVPLALVCIPRPMTLSCYLPQPDCLLPSSRR